MLKKEYEKELSLIQIINYLWSRIFKIIIMGVIMALISMGLKYFMATASTCYVSQTTYNPTSNYIGQGKIYLGEDISTQKAETIRIYLMGKSVLQSVINELNLKLLSSELYSMISLNDSTNNIIMIAITGKDEEQIEEITNAFITIGNKMISEKFQLDDSMILESAYTNLVIVNQETVIQTFSISRLFKTLFQYALIGFLLGIILISFLYITNLLFGNKINNEKDIVGYLGIQVVGIIPIIKGTQN
jgi:capsular polysaccharide biosynthesis protein